MKQHRLSADPLATPTTVAPALRLGWRSGVRRLYCGAAAIAPFALAPAPAQAQEYFSPTNDYGTVGLLQTPSARFPEEGEVRLGYSRPEPYAHYFVTAAPFDWLQASFRYTKFTNEPLSYDPDSDYLDKGFDFKFRLLREREYLPQIALGLQDFGGTGLQSGEYFVASKRAGPLDFSFGLGWGRLGAGGGITNPFTYVSDHFEESRETDAAGSVTFKNLFVGDEIAPFGGITFQPEGAPWAILVEREGNDYSQEPFDNDLDRKWPVNIGFNYKYRFVDMGVSFERGDQVSFHIALVGNVKGPGPVKRADPPPTPVGPPEFAPSRPSALAPSGTSGGAGEAASDAPSEAAFVDDLREALARQGIALIAVDLQPEMSQATIWYRQDQFRNEALALTRVARSAASLAPAEYDRFTLAEVANSLEFYRATVDRKTIRQAANLQIDSQTLARNVRLEAPEPHREPVDYDLSHYPAFDWSTGPRLRQSIGDPQQFWFGQVWWDLAAGWQLTDKLSLTGEVGFNIWNNFDEIERESDSTLPHVRSDVAEYLDQGENGLIRLEADYITPLARHWYGRVSAGLFEEMYGGVAGEVLYRPYGEPWAVSVDVAHVRKRDYDQRLDFLDYEVTTGHARFFYRLARPQVLVQLAAGRYLAKDWGATLDLSREFASGARLGVFATKTDVSAEEFGEGEFDKGFYIYLPLDLFFDRSTKETTSLFFRPLTRDGGQQVIDGPRLYDLTESSDRHWIDTGWDDALR